MNATLVRDGYTGVCSQCDGILTLFKILSASSWMVDSFTVNPFTLSLSSAMVIVISMLNLNKFYAQSTSAAYAKPSF